MYNNNRNARRAENRHHLVELLKCFMLDTVQQKIMLEGIVDRRLAVEAEGGRTHHHYGGSKTHYTSNASIWRARA